MVCVQAINKVLSRFVLKKYCHGLLGQCRRILKMLGKVCMKKVAAGVGKVKEAARWEARKDLGNLCRALCFLNSFSFFIYSSLLYFSKFERYEYHQLLDSTLKLFDLRVRFQLMDCFKVWKETVTNYLFEINYSEFPCFQGWLYLSIRVKQSWSRVPGRRAEYGCQQVKYFCCCRVSRESQLWM